MARRGDGRRVCLPKSLGLPAGYRPRRADAGVLSLLLAKPMQVVVDAALNAVQGVWRDVTGEQAVGYGREGAGYVANLVNQRVCCSG